MLLISYSIFSAMLGSQSVLFGKSISVILRTTFSGNNQLGNWYTWVVLPIFAFTALFWVTRLNKVGKSATHWARRWACCIDKGTSRQARSGSLVCVPHPLMSQGLRMFPAMLIVPLMQIAWTLFSIVSGMIYFQEYLGFTTLKAIMFTVGVLVGGTNAGHGVEAGAAGTAMVCRR